MGFGVVTLGHSLLVTTPTGVLSSLELCAQEVIINILECSFIANIFVFGMAEFDVIFGMDLISKNGALIDCKKKVHYRKGTCCTF